MRTHALLCFVLPLACAGSSAGDTGETSATTGVASTGEPPTTGGASSPEGTTEEPPTTGDAPPPTLQVVALADLGLLPLPSEVTAGRDGGQGGLLGGRLLWTFGDTFLTMANSIDQSNVLSATAGWSSPDDPLALVQPVDEHGLPAQFIPYTAAEVVANKADALNGWALWPGGLFDTGAAEGLVVFHRIKRTDGSGFASMGVGTARIAVDATVAVRDPDDLFAPPEPIFKPDSVVDGYALAFACESIGFLEVGCKLARAPIEKMDVRAAYEFHDGSGWQPDITLAAYVFDKFSGPPSISYNNYLQRYLAVGGKVLDSTIELRVADDVAGPYGDPVTIEIGDEYLGPLDPEAFNYVVREHPELVSADGREVVLSYSRPTEPFRGDVRLMRVTLG